MDQRGIDAGFTDPKAGMEFHFGGKTCQLWSFMSVTNDQYVWITNDSAGNGNNSYEVEATGKAEGNTLPLLQITFTEAGDDLFYMQFQKNNETYEVQASEDNGVKAVKGSDGDPTKWLPISMEPPNEPYYAFKSDQGRESRPLYLSSDGNGNMQLKGANTTDFLPPRDNPFIDPALLFRAIEPLV